MKRATTRRIKRKIMAASYPETKYWPRSRRDLETWVVTPGMTIPPMVVGVSLDESDAFPSHKPSGFPLTALQQEAVNYYCPRCGGLERPAFGGKPHHFEGCEGLWRV